MHLAKALPQGGQQEPARGLWGHLGEEAAGMHNPTPMQSPEHILSGNTLVIGSCEFP